MPEPRHSEGRRRPDVEAALRQLAGRIDVPPEPDYATRVQQRIQPVPGAGAAPGRWTLRPLPALVAAAVAFLAAVAVVLSVPAARDAVADLFGLDGVRVNPLPTTGPTPRTTIDDELDLGTPVTLAEARRRLDLRVVLPRSAGFTAPDAVYLQRGPGLESVSLVYRPREDLPPAVGTRVGLLLSAYAGTATPYFEKFVGPGSQAVQVTVDDRWPGLYFPSPGHEVLVRDATGFVHGVRPRLAAPTLVWVQDGVTYRLEGDIARSRALEIAASVP